jgi:Autographiviridae endonuclease
MDEPTPTQRKRKGPVPRPLSVRLWSRVNILSPDGCWLWTGSVRPTGYGQIGAGAGRVVSTHRAAWEVSRGPVPDPTICFSVPRPTTRPTLIAKGRAAKPEQTKHLGPENGRAVLTWDQVREIRATYRRGSREAGSYALAARYGVSPFNVLAIVKGETWREDASK